MIPIFWKEVRQNFLFFLLMVGVGVISIAVLWGTNNMDRSFALMLLCSMEAPILIFLTGHHLIQTEIQGNTLPFTLSLPLSRARIWAGKALFGGAYAVALNGVFLGLVWATTVSESAKYDVFAAAGLAEYLLYGFIFPLVPFTWGFFTSQFPEGFPTLFNLVLLTGIGIGFASSVFVAVNPLLTAIFVIAIFGISGLMTFRSGELLVGWRTIIHGLLWTLGLSACALVFWGTLDRIQLFSASPETARFEYTGDSAPRSGTVPFNLSVSSHWWDPVDCKRDGRVGIIDLETGRTRFLGPRMSEVRLVSPSGRKLLCRSFHLTPGFFTPNRWVLIDLDEPASFRNVRADGRPVAFIDEDTILFCETIGRSGSETTTTLWLVRTSGEKRMVYAIPGSFRDRVWALPKLGLAILRSAELGEHPRLIKIPDGALVRGELPESISDVVETGSGSIIISMGPVQEGGMPKEMNAPALHYRYARIVRSESDPSGCEVTHLKEIPSNEVFLGETYDGRLLFRSAAPLPASGLASHVVLATRAPTGSDPRLIREFDADPVRVDLSPDGRCLFIEEMVAGNNTPGLMRLDRLASQGYELTPVSGCPKGYCKWIRWIDSDRLCFHDSGLKSTLYEIRASSAMARPIQLRAW